MINLELLIAYSAMPHRTALDVGSGNGWRADMLRAQFGLQVIGVDAWEKAKADVYLDVCKEPLPFLENSFDCVYAIDFIEHLTKDKALDLMEQCKKICSSAVILLTPEVWSDNAHNVNNPSLWCYQNQYDYHVSHWTQDDFGREWERIEAPGVYLMRYLKKQ